MLPHMSSITLVVTRHLKSLFESQLTLFMELIYTYVLYPDSHLIFQPPLPARSAVKVRFRESCLGSLALLPACLSIIHLVQMLTLTETNYTRSLAMAANTIG